MTTALYRRYRPETFADVIGQEHVTEPLMTAISGRRTSHAYLFSGPRGCGKTTSARILARCLNCEQGPTPTPCGTCPSCVELARGGPGSLDVVEIDAASHNGVDDARELRERAAFAPARDRYKVFILDEAHMVTTQGFNALLKLVEEPPPHVTFIFATTEPDKVISTIRSRTHHYPFRLVPPDTLQAYLEQICGAEGVSVGSGVLPLVVRAGGGSVRDSLSVLDQLLAGAEGALDYAQAVALLGYTPTTLLDDVVDALEAADGASVFRVVDRVIESGHDPRRFVEDLLQRLRDLIVIVAAGERAGEVLRSTPQDELATMVVQAGRLGLAQLSRAADLAMAALTEMTGATSPRLQLELLCARLLLPAADEPLRGYGARIERLERRGESAGTGTPGSGTSGAGTPGSVSSGTPAPPSATSSTGTQDTGTPDTGTPDTGTPVHDAPVVGDPVAGPPPSPTRTVDRPQPAPSRLEASTAPDLDAERSPSPGDDADRSPSPDLDVETVRRRWPEVLDTLSRMRRASWTITSQNAQVAEVTGSVLRLRFDTEGIASTFRNGQHADVVQRALRETLGLDLRVEPLTGDRGSGSGGSGTGTGSGSARSRSGGRGKNGPAVRAEDVPADHVARAEADWSSGGSSRPGVAAERGAGLGSGPADTGGRDPGAGDRGRDAATSPGSGSVDRPAASRMSGQAAGVGRPGGVGSSRSRGGRAGQQAGGRSRGAAATAGPEPAAGDGQRREEPPREEPPVQEPPREEPPVQEPPLDEPPLDEQQLEEPPPAEFMPPPEDERRGGDPFAGADTPDRPDPDDPDLDPDGDASSPLIGAPLVQRVLGGTVIDEIPVDPSGSGPRSGS